MTSLIEKNNKFQLYSINNRYFTVCKHGYYPTFSKKQKRNVKIDWERTSELIEEASINPDISFDNFCKYNIEKKTDIDNVEMFKILDDRKFWKIINKIPYYDKDENKMNINSINLKPKICKKILDKINTELIPELKLSFSNISTLECMNDPNEYNNFLTHIIFKGEIFYNGIKNDPVVCLYLQSDYQYYPIYNWIEKISSNL